MASRLPNRARPPRRHAPSGFAPGFAPGFTLVELLMVILIIGMLMALLITAVFTAKRTAEQARVTLEIQSLGLALEDYKNTVGEYPPDFGHLSMSNGTYVDQVVLRHFRRAFGRYPAQFTAQWSGGASSFTATFQARSGRDIWDTDGAGTADTTGLDPAEVLPFFLGGMARAGTSTDLDGFSANRADPFFVGPPGSTVQRTKKLFEFVQTRLGDRDNDGFPEYYPPGTSTRLGAPYVYFAARPGFTVNARYGGTYRLPGVGGTATPYLLDIANANGPPNGQIDTDSNGNLLDSWVEVQRFQIIAAGYDNDYGAAAFKLFPSGRNYGLGDLDNLTNFSQGSLEDAKGSK